MFSVALSVPDKFNVLLIVNDLLVLDPPEIVNPVPLAVRVNPLNNVEDKLPVLGTYVSLVDVVFNALFPVFAEAQVKYTVEEVATSFVIAILAAFVEFVTAVVLIAATICAADAVAILFVPSP